MDARAGNGTGWSSASSAFLLFRFFPLHIFCGQKMAASSYRGYAVQLKKKVTKRIFFSNKVNWLRTYPRSHLQLKLAMEIDC